MANQTLLTALTSLIILLSLCYLLFWRYRQFRIDSFRQEIFTLRDELFDFANDGHIAFDDPAYGMLRSTMNGFIRFGHKLTLWHVVFLNLFIRRRDVEVIGGYEAKWRDVTEGLPDETVTRLGQFRERMEWAAFKHVHLSAPEFFIFIPLLFVVLTGYMVYKGYRSRQTIWVWLRRRFINIDDAALLYGEAAA